MTSIDGGRTWSPVVPTGLWGYPPFLLRASSGVLITTLGHRREPRGIQIAISEDHGAFWSPQQALNTDSGGDLGTGFAVKIRARMPGGPRWRVTRSVAFQVVCDLP